MIKPPSMLPEMTRVRSTNIYSIGYDADLKLLYVRFRHRKTKGRKPRRTDRKPQAKWTNRELYRYFHVPATLASRFMRVHSKGKFFHRNVRPRYRYQLWTGSHWRTYGAQRAVVTARRRQRLKKLDLARARMRAKRVAGGKR